MLKVIFENMLLLTFFIIDIISIMGIITIFTIAWWNNIDRKQVVAAFEKIRRKCNEASK